MANFFNKAKIKIAQEPRKNLFNLDHSHITTMDFYDPRPVFCELLKPGDSAKVDLTVMSRVSPLVEPMMGDARIVNRAFFVPCRTVQEGFNNFITDTPYFFGSEDLPTQIKRVAWASNAQFCNVFTTPTYGLSVQVSGTEKWDFTLPNNESTDLVGYKFTYKGKRFYNIITGLGIRFNFDDHDISPINILPIFSFLKLHFDWLKNPAYNTFDNVVKHLKGKVPTNGFTADVIASSLNACYKICYASDYFTSAWDNPLAPNGNTVSDASIPDIVSSNNNQYKEQVSLVNGNTDGYDVPGINNPSSTNSLGRISDYMIQSLHKLTDYIKRKQLAGSRVLDRYLVEYGIQLESAKLDRSIYLGKSDVPLMITDVMQTTPDVRSGDSLATGIGSYSGKGFAAGSDHIIDFSTDEWGYLIILSYIEPRVSYIHGQRKQYISRFDFYTEEFDGLGTEAISMRELCSGNIWNDDIQFVTQYNPDAIFGFTPRYSSFKCIQDKVTGDFMCNSKNTNLGGWLLTRDFQLIEDATTDYKHSLEFTEADPADFQNIFQYGNNQASGSSTNFFDHFYMKYVFRYSKYSFMKPMFDFHDFDSEGKEVTVDVNGTQVTN